MKNTTLCEKYWRHRAGWMWIFGVKMASPVICEMVADKFRLIDILLKHVSTDFMKLYTEVLPSSCCVFVHYFLKLAESRSKATLTTDSVMRFL